MVNLHNMNEYEWALYCLWTGIANKEKTCLINWGMWRSGGVAGMRQVNSTAGIFKLNCMWLWECGCRISIQTSRSHTDSKLIEEPLSVNIDRLIKVWRANSSSNVSSAIYTTSACRQHILLLYIEIHLNWTTSLSCP